MKLGLNGKRALVIGASRGLGAAIAIALANEGATVIGAARSEGEIGALNSSLLPDTEGRIEGRHLDLEDPVAVDALSKDLMSSGGVDILVNNSGGPPPGEARGVAPETFNRQFEVMVGSLISLTQSLLPAMAERKWGRIVTLTSSGVEVPIPRLAISNALRQSLVGYMKTLANEVAADGITVNIVVQGRIHTDRVDQLDAAAAERTGRTIDDIRAASRQTIPANRYGKPEELADAVAFLASERASYITGSKLRVDGGMIGTV